jgi:hypothetical protein
LIRRGPLQKEIVYAICGKLMVFHVSTTYINKRHAGAPWFNSTRSISIGTWYDLLQDTFLQRITRNTFYHLNKKEGREELTGK